MEMLKLGPVGNNTFGIKWEETGRDQISHIFVGYYPGCSVRSIQFGYVVDGALVLSEKYGSADAYDSTRVVRFNHESEFVTGISGEIYMDFYISSLTFHTNERDHEVFRAELKCDSPRGRQPVRMEFHSGIHDRREFGGFFGTYASSLRSIGLYIKPVISGVHTIKHENV